MKFEGKFGPVYAAHRGYSEKYFENTMEAFRAAMDCGADMIETDIHMTKDGHLVIMHDHDVERTTDGSGLICEKTLEEVRRLNAGNALMAAHVPTLDEFLDFTDAYPELLLDLEIKVYLNNEGADRVKETVDKTVAAVRKHGLEKRVMFNCFDAFVLEYLDEAYHKQFILHGYYPYEKWLSNISRNPEEYLDYACYWGKGEVGKQTCEYLLSKGIEPCTGSRNKKPEYLEALSFGCSMFTENDIRSYMKWAKEAK